MVKAAVPLTSVGLLVHGINADYQLYHGKTAYEWGDHGAKDIDTDDTAPTGMSVNSCEARCDGDASCDCVAFRPSDGKCWKRAACVPAKFGTDSLYDTYVKVSAPPPPPSPTPSPTPTPTPTPGGSGSGCKDTSGWVNQYEGNNPLGIKPAANREDNYFLIIGDWGKDGGPGSCQNRVAELMKQYVQNQAEQGKKLLFIASVGDNFYWSGQDGSKWSSQWDDVYGTSKADSPLYDIPWLAVLGNHDIGTSDATLACPGSAKYATVGGQDYGSRQFNKDKNPARPDWTSKFWMPDYNFHYEIPEVGIEVVGVDTNGDHVDELNGSGHSADVWNACGGRGNVQGFLGMIKNSGDEVLKCRAEKGSASTVLVMQHYPSNKWDVKGTFEGALGGRQANVLTAYGHVHEQKCEGNNAQGQCNVIMTGSGGGCCETDLPHNHAGFTAVHLTSDGGFTSDVESGDVRLPQGACTWNYDYFRSWWNDTRANAYV